MAGSRSDLAAVWPPELGSIQVMKADVVHFSSHGGQGGLLLQDRAGNSVVHTGASLAAALADPPALVVLSGCDTQDAGSQLNLDGQVSVVCTEGYLPDDAAVAFAFEFYARLARGQKFEPAVDEVNRVLKGQWPSAIWRFHEGRVNQIRTVEGVATVAPAVRAVTRAASGSLLTVPSRRELLPSLYRQLESNYRGASVTGPPRGGVTTLLRTFADYYDWLPSSGTSYFDFRSLRKHEHGALVEALGTPDGLVIVDHADEGDSEMAELIATTLRQDPSRRAWLLIGASTRGGFSDLPNIPLSPWTRSEAAGWLQEELGDVARPALWTLDEIDLFPGKLQALRVSISNGANERDLRRFLAIGDPESVRRVIDVAWSVPQLRILLYPLVKFEFSRRSTLRSVWMALIDRYDEVAEELFETCLMRLADLRLVQISPSIEPDGTPSFHLGVDPDVRSAVRRRRVPITPEQMGKAMGVALGELRELNELGHLDANDDWRWLSNLMAEAASRGCLEAEVLDEVFPHLDKGGRMRMVSDIAKQREIVDSAFHLARSVGQWDRACQLALVRGEMRYRAAELSAAESEFNRIFRLFPSDTRRVQAYRAIGQVYYRRGDYAGAVEVYRRARKFLVDAEAFAVATILQEEGKALSRLGRNAEAITVLRDVLRRREGEGNVREIIKAQHELARALLRIRDIPEAEELFSLARDGATSSDSLKWALGPMHHLFLIALERGDLDTAKAHHAELSATARRINERLWTVFARLGEAMLLFAEGRFQGSHHVLVDALAQANKYGYAQVKEDAQDWVRRQAFRLSLSLGGSMSGDVVDVLALVEGVPAGKARKALRYATSPESIASVEVLLRSEHGDRRIAWTPSAGWTCTCPMFDDTGKCSHVVAVELRGVAPAILDAAKSSPHLEEGNGDVRTDGRG